MQLAPELPLRNDQKAVRPARLGIGKWTTPRAVVSEKAKWSHCTTCHVQIDGRAITISATECIGTGGSHSFDSFSDAGHSG